MAVPTEKEIEHGINLLHETEDWEGRFAVIAIDPNCRWKDEHGVCRKPLYNAIVLLRDDQKSVDVVCFCNHHSACMVKSIERWREMN